MTWEDPARDPIPPGHGEPRAEADHPIPFKTVGPAWQPGKLPEQQFGVPLCPRCFYYHSPEETCRR